MTCGVCGPKAFRPATGNWQIGYTVFSDLRSAAMGGAVPNLYYMGCELVLTDIAQAKINLSHRPGYRALFKILRRGDRLVIDSPKVFGTKPQLAENHTQSLADMGVQLMILTEKCEELRRAA